MQLRNGKTTLWKCCSTLVSSMSQEWKPCSIKARPEMQDQHTEKAMKALRSLKPFFFFFSWLKLRSYRWRGLKNFSSRSLSCLLKWYNVHHLVTGNEAETAVMECLSFKSKRRRYFATQSDFAILSLPFTKCSNGSFQRTRCTNPAGLNPQLAEDLKSNVWG